MLGFTANVGDTLTHATTTNIEPLPGFKPMQSMVFAGVFPLDAQDFQKLEEAIGRVRPPLGITFALTNHMINQLTLNDRSGEQRRCMLLKTRC